MGPLLSIKMALQNDDNAIQQKQYEKDLLLAVVHIEA